MRRFLAIAVTAAALLAPSAALAADPQAPAVDRTFVIQGLILGQQKIEASGKLAILRGTQLAASVGCNSIGGSVTVDGDTVTIDTPLVMTEMACPGSGDTEAALIKILQLGRFAISNDGWFAEGGAILAVELPSTNPAPDQTPPDQPIGVEPSGPPLPIESCPPNAGTGSGTGGGTATGGSTATGGGTSSGGAVGSGGSVSSGGGSDGTGSGSAPAATAIAVPAETPASAPGGEPAATPVDVPPATPIVEPLPPAPEPSLGQTEPGPVEPGGPIVVGPPVEVSPIPIDPGIVPLPGMSEPPNGCYAYPADALNAGGVPPVAQPGVGTATDLAERAGATDTAAWPLLAVVLVLAMAGVGMIGRWMLAGRRPAEDVTRP